MLLRAFAKINLDLRILGLRPDGYHEIRTILQTIDWCDEIRIEPSERFLFRCTGGPEDASNLVVRAVREFERAVEEPVHVRIELTKKIPIGAGLGGGSADAAVTLMGLQDFTGKTLSAPEYMRCLQALGSDVPFFAAGGRATGIGRGDELIQMEDDTAYSLVIVLTGLMIATAEAYSWLTLPGESNNIEGFYAQLDPAREEGASGNDFESAVFGRHPVLGEIKNELLRLGARQAALSGSGSALFGCFDREKDAVKAASGLARYGTARVTRPLTKQEYLQSIFVRKA